MMRSKPIRRTATVACCAILAGMGAAGARALEVPTLPAPTLPTPTVPVPTPTVPVPAPTPTVPVPAPVPTPPPVTPTPTVPAPTPVPLPTPTPTPNPTPALPAPIGSSPAPGGTGGTLLGSPTGSFTGSSSSPLGASSSGTAAASGSPAAPEGTRPGEKTIAVAATTTRRRPGVVTVRFTLAGARRVMVILRGPLPSCNTTARFALRGHRGTNAVRFNGTVGEQRVEPGSYLLGIKPVTGSTVRWAAVHVGPRGAQPLPRRIVHPALDQCSSPTAFRALLAGWFDSTPMAGGTAGAEATKVMPPQPVERVPAPEASVLPFSGIQDAAAELPSALGYFLLAIIGGTLLGLGFFVVRFIRTPPTA